MAGTATTCADPSTIGRELEGWCLTLVHGVDPRAIGRRRLLGPGESLELGRGSLVFGAGALDDERISRAHVRIREGERVALEDLGSHNGSFVDGRRVARERLEAGAVIGFGRSLVLLHRGPVELPTPAPIAGLVGCGAVHARLHEAVEKVASRSTAVLLLGPSGAGKSQLAAAIHEQSARSGPLHVIHCGVAASEAQLDAVEASATLVLDNIDEASGALAARLLAQLDRDREHEARIIATSRTQPSRASAGGKLRDDLALRLERWLIHVPVLLARREDITLLARSFAERYSDDPRPLHPKLALALLLHDWPGNLHELEAVIECACIDAEPGRALPLSAQVRARLERGEGQAEAEASAEPELASAMPPCLQIAADGSWFGLVGEERVEIGHRKPLARLVRALADQRLHHPGEPLGARELLGFGWPDEQVVERAGANRVYVALTTLRKLGLRQHIHRDEQGYLFAPQLHVELV